MDQERSERPRQDIVALMQDQVRFWQAIAENASHIAASKRTLFLAYVAEGFTEIQALELVKGLS